MPDFPETPAPEPQEPKQPEELVTTPDAPTPDAAPAMPTDFDWDNITNIWQAINHARQTKSQQEWLDVTKAVHEALKGWRMKETKWTDELKKLQIIKKYIEHAPEGEKRQKVMDSYQKVIDGLPHKMQQAARQGKTIAPVRVKTIDELIRTLEGIQQGDFESYHPDVKNRIRTFQLNREHDQHVYRQQIKIQNERLNGIKDPARRLPLERRLKDLGERLSRTEDELEAKQISKEADALIRRLEGAQTEAGRAKIADNIEKIRAKVKTPEELRVEQLAYSDSLKYDALLWLVTVISHPIKATPAPVPGSSRGPSAAARPVGQGPYLPPKAGNIWQPPKEPPAPAGKPGVKPTGEHWRPYKRQVTKPPASECRIFLSLIHEGKLAQAKRFMESPFTVAEGSLVVLENIADMPELNGLKGRVRTFSEELGRSVIVDLFKNNIVADQAIIAALYETRPYLQ